MKTIKRVDVIWILPMLIAFGFILLAYGKHREIQGIYKGADAVWTTITNRIAAGDLLMYNPKKIK